MTLNKHDAKVFAKLLKRASEEFGSHGCNDMELPDSPEARDLAASLERWNSGGRDPDPEFEDGQPVYFQDYALLGYLAHLIENAAASGWIPVGNRLPAPPEGNVLVLLNKGGRLVMQYSHDEADWIDYELVFLKQANANRVPKVFGPTEVTHWMPLPPAP